MENASDAIIIGGAMLIFAIALALTMTMFSQARVASEAVLYASDPTNYYEYIGNDNNTAKNRIVSWETVIPTLYKYYKENYTVVFLDSSGNGMHLYQTKTNPLNWSGNKTGTKQDIPPIVNKYPGMDQGTKTQNINICSFDVEEETKRHEPWTGTTEDYKDNLDTFLKGGEFHYPSDKNIYMDYGEGFVNKFSTNVKFIETIGEYSTNTKGGLASELNQGIRDNKNKRVIVYKLYIS